MYLSVLTLMVTLSLSLFPSPSPPLPLFLFHSPALAGVNGDQGLLSPHTHVKIAALRALAARGASGGSVDTHIDVHADALMGVHGLQTVRS